MMGSNSYIDSSSWRHCMDLQLIVPFPFYLSLSLSLVHFFVPIFVFVFVFSSFFFFFSTFFNLEKHTKPFTREACPNKNIATSLPPCFYCTQCVPKSCRLKTPHPTHSLLWIILLINWIFPHVCSFCKNNIINNNNDSNNDNIKKKQQNINSCFTNQLMPCQLFPVHFGWKRWFFQL